MAEDVKDPVAWFVLACGACGDRQFFERGLVSWNRDHRGSHGRMTGQVLNNWTVRLKRHGTSPHHPRER